MNLAIALSLISSAPGATASLDFLTATVDLVRVSARGLLIRVSLGWIVAQINRSRE